MAKDIQSEIAEIKNGLAKWEESEDVSEKGLELKERMIKSLKLELAKYEIDEGWENFKEILKAETPINLVECWNRDFNHPTFEYPTDPNKELSIKRLRLILEELHELATALSVEQEFCDLMLTEASHCVANTGEINMPEALDAVTDLRVVLYGAINAFGLTNLAEPAFNEVMKSNYSKMCKTEEEAKISKQKYADAGRDVNYQEAPTGFVMKEVGTDKILKSYLYQPANLTKFF